MSTTTHAYSSGQAARAVNITQRQLDRWATQEIVVPSIEVGKGAGGVRAYSLSDVIALAVVDKMKESGFALRQLAGLAAAIQRWEDGSSETWFIGNEDGTVSSHDETGALDALRKMDRKGLTWFMSIDDVIEETRGKLLAVPRATRGKPNRIA